MSRPALIPLFFLTASLLLAGCDQLGIETPALEAQRRVEEGKAVGGACRHAGRAIEDCYTINKKGDKAAIFAGWREMNDYMRENKIEAVTPQLTANVMPKLTEEPAEVPKPPEKAKAKDKHGT